MSKEVRVIRIAVSPAAKAVIEGVARENDMKEQGVASRIYEWFGKQPDHIQRAIIGLYGARQGDIVREILQEMLDEPPGKGRSSGRRA